MKHTRSLLLTIVGLFLFGGIGFAAVPNFSFVPASGAKLNMYCSNTVNIYLTAGGNLYNTYQTTLQFDAANTQLTPGSLHAPLTAYPVNAIEGGNRYRVGANFAPIGASWNADLTVADFSLRTITPITSTQLKFVNIDGSFPIQYGRTDFGQSLFGVLSGENILADLYDATYSFVPYPCVADGNAPGVYNLSPWNTANNIASNATVSFLTYDWQGTNGHYWYQGLSTGSIANYVSVGANYVDNQEGVDSSKIRVTVACPACSTPWSKVLSGSDLTIVPWTGNGSINAQTWDSHYRGYVVSFPSSAVLPGSYEVEKQINVTIATTDNPNQLLATNTNTGTSYFNAPNNPTINRLLPSTSTFVSTSKTNLIKYSLADTWAGVNTGSVKITIPQIMSGVQLLLTGYTYSWSDLLFTPVSGTPGIGNAGSYTVEFYPKWDLPAYTGISINTVFTDLAGNTGTLNDTFTTRPDCSFFGCNEILSINILGGTNAGTFTFTGALLVVTGTNANSPYPYLTGINNDTIMCGTPWTGTSLGGNITITDSASNPVTSYTGNRLYITGLNFTLSGGVINVQ